MDVISGKQVLGYEGILCIFKTKKTVNKKIIKQMKITFREMHELRKIIVNYSFMNISFFLNIQILIFCIKIITKINRHYEFERFCIHISFNQITFKFQFMHSVHSMMQMEIYIIQNTKSYKDTKGCNSYYLCTVSSIMNKLENKVSYEK